MDNANKMESFKTLFVMLLETMAAYTFSLSMLMSHISTNLAHYVHRRCNVVIIFTFKPEN